ncbi:MAG: heat-inducible transcription repressor HrcA [Firmicutes bacterium HGW-Firmicutes-16]|nr:MAG: heat-inducible transcription repressor HrcA [Firmicutes bacterium HGW-Firmicutes-16]
MRGERTLEIGDRKKKILTAVIDEYIATAEPVGSKSIVESGVLDLSSATIRNEMAELTAMGFLEQPHTSAGRIPSPQGYRLYVNELMERQRLSIDEADAINDSLSQKMKQLDKMMSDVGKLASSMTHYPAVALAAPVASTIKRFDLIYVDFNTFIAVAMLSNDSVHNKLIHLPFSVDQGMIVRLASVFNTNFVGIQEEKITPTLIGSAERACGDTMGLVSVIAAFAIDTLGKAKEGQSYVTGETHLLRLPEFRDPDKAREVMSYLSDSEHLLGLPNDGSDDDIQVIIGPENVAKELKDSSVVIARYNAGDNMKGIIGIVGPTRMDYSGVAAKLRYIAEGLSHVLAMPEAPRGFEKLQIKEMNTNGHKEDV